MARVKGQKREQLINDLQEERLFIILKGNTVLSFELRGRSPLEASFISWSMKCQ